MRAALRNLSVGAMTKQQTETSATATDWRGKITEFMEGYWDGADVSALVGCVIRDDASTLNDDFYIEMEEGTVSSTKKDKYTKKSTIILHRTSHLGMYISINERIDDEAYEWASRLFIAKFDENNASGIESAWRECRVKQAVNDMHEQSNKTD